MTKADIKQKFAHMIEDWWEPSGEEFKYDIMLKVPYTWSSWELNRQCQHTEIFETLQQVYTALRNAKKVSVEEHCMKCRFWNGYKCIK